MNVIINDYFDWIYFKLVNRPHKNHFRKLFYALFDTEFRYSVDYDENRASDGENMRWYYVNEGGNDKILSWKAPANVLEVILSLAFHMESIMDDPDNEMDVRYWFWDMIKNLGLDDITDDNYDRKYVYGTISIFMDRIYSPDGDGNIFYISNCKDDLRDVELWMQMCWYLDEID